VRVFFDGPPELRYRARLEVRLAVSAPECQMHLRLVSKRFFHLSKNLRGALVIAQVETGHGKIVAVGECWIEIHGYFQLFSCFLVAALLKQNAAQQLMGLSEFRAIFRILPYELRRQHLRPTEIAKRQRRSRIVEKQRRRVWLQDQSFIEQRPNLGAIVRQTIAERQLIKGVSEKCAVLFCRLIELARTLLLLRVDIALP